MTSVVKDVRFQRALTAVFLLAAFSFRVLSVDAQPFPMPPLYGGAWHPWIAMAALAGFLGGAVFFGSPWARAQAWATGAGFMMFEAAFAASRMPTISPVSFPLCMRPWTVPLSRGFVAGFFCLLCFLPDLLAARKSEQAD
jgi:hypothetical protein